MAEDLSNFVYLEAKEKAFEIEIESRKQFEQKKKVIVEAKIAEVIQQYKTLEEGKHTQYKMYFSEKINSLVITPRLLTSKGQKV
jgi:hypothetical protein